MSNHLSSCLFFFFYLYFTNKAQQKFSLEDQLRAYKPDVHGSFQLALQSSSKTKRTPLCCQRFLSVHSIINTKTEPMNPSPHCAYFTQNAKQPVLGILLCPSLSGCVLYSFSEENNIVSSWLQGSTKLWRDTHCVPLPLNNRRMGQP